MTLKGFTALALVTLLCVVAAAVAVTNRAGLSQAGLQNQPAFPALRASPESVASIKIRGSQGSVELRRSADGDWQVADRASYPASAKKVKDAIVNLSDMQLIEPKTSLPNRYAKLEVENPDQADAKSRWLEVLDQDGQILARAIVGKRVWRKVGTAENGLYLRRDGDPQSWLASGGFDPKEDPAGWLDKSIIEIPASRIATVELRPLDSPAYRLERGESGDLRLAGETIDAEAKQDALNAMAEILEALTLADVSPEDEIDWPAEVAQTRFETAEGTTVTLETADLGDEIWAKVIVSSDATGQSADEVKALKRRFEPWVFRLSDYSGGRLRTPLVDLYDMGEPAS